MSINWLIKGINCLINEHIQLKQTIIKNHITQQTIMQQKVQQEQDYSYQTVQSHCQYKTDNDDQQVSLITPIILQPSKKGKNGYQQQKYNHTKNRLIQVGRLKAQTSSSIHIKSNKDTTPLQKQTGSKIRNRNIKHGQHNLSKVDIDNMEDLVNVDMKSLSNNKNTSIKNVKRSPGSNKGLSLHFMMNRRDADIEYQKNRQAVIKYHGNSQQNHLVRSRRYLDQNVNKKVENGVNTSENGIKPNRHLRGQVQKNSLIPSINRNRRIISLKDVLRKSHDHQLHKFSRTNVSLNTTQLKQDSLFNQPQRNSKRQVVFIRTFILSTFQSISIEISLLNQSIVIQGSLIGQQKSILKLIISAQQSKKLQKQSFDDWQIIAKRIYVSTSQVGDKRLRIGPISSIFSSIQQKHSKNTQARQVYTNKKVTLSKRQLYMRQKSFINRNFYSISNKEDQTLNKQEKDTHKNTNNNITNNSLEIQHFTLQNEQILNNKVESQNHKRIFQRQSKQIDYLSRQIKSKVKEIITQKQESLNKQNKQSVQQQKFKRQAFIKKQFLLVKRLSKPKQTLITQEKSKEKSVNRIKSQIPKKIQRIIKIEKQLTANNQGVKLIKMQQKREKKFKDNSISQLNIIQIKNEINQVVSMQKTQNDKMLKSQNPGLNFTQELKEVHQKQQQNQKIYVQGNYNGEDNNNHGQEYVQQNQNQNQNQQLIYEDQSSDDKQIQKDMIFTLDNVKILKQSINSTKSLKSQIQQVKQVGNSFIKQNYQEDQEYAENYQKLQDSNIYPQDQKRYQNKDKQQPQQNYDDTFDLNQQSQQKVGKQNQEQKQRQSVPNNKKLKPQNQNCQPEQYYNQDGFQDVSNDNIPKNEQIQLQNQYLQEEYNSFEQQINDQSVQK